jgi:hypothetical protein
MSRPRIHVRDAVKAILADLDNFFERSPAVALQAAFRRVRSMTADALTRLRKRQFGTIPNTQQEALRFLARRFREHEANLEELESIESFTDTATTETAESSSSSDSDNESSSSSDSDRTVPIDLRPFTPYVDKYGYLVKSEGSVEI